jgi:predicted adenylyl cyclase CyaB
MEIESKFKVRSAGEIRAKLAEIGARFLSREFERDTYYAVPGGANLTTVRLRDLGQKGLFTIKSMPTKGAPAKLGLKVLDEIQVEVEDASRFSRMLEILGFSAHSRKEKIRESYDWNGLPIFLDELPYLGFFLEIEASEEGINAAASALSLDPTQAIGETYLQLFSRYKTVRNAPDLELVFDKEIVFP